jgi:hypothetical protein
MILILFGERVQITKAVDGGNGVHIWRVDANILNKPIRGGPPVPALNVGLTNPHRKKKVMKQHKSLH